MEQILETIRKIIRKETSLRKLAKEINVDRSSLYFSLKRNPTLKTITKVLDHLDYEIRIVKSKRKVKRTKSINKGGV